MSPCACDSSLSGAMMMSFGTCPNMFVLPPG